VTRLGKTLATETRATSSKCVVALPGKRSPASCA